MRIHNTEWTVSNLHTQHSYVIFNSAYLSLSVKLDTYTFSFESISVFLSTLICRIYKWNIQTLLGFFLLFLLSRTESLCLLIFLYILMFYQDHRKYYEGYYGKLKKTSASNLCADSYTYFVFYVDTTLNNCCIYFQQKSLSIRLYFFRSKHKAIYVITWD